MKLMYEKSQEGRHLTLVPSLDVPETEFPQNQKRKSDWSLPKMGETDLSRHYTELAKCTYGVNNGFYPLGSCTMKYNPGINEEIASLKEFTQIHPLQPVHTIQGCLEVLHTAKEFLCEVTGMDDMTFQPAAGAHGELTGLLLMKAYHKAKNQGHRDKIIVPDSAHGTNPASGVMAGYQIINIPSKEDGCLNIEKLKEALGEDTAGLMLTNPNTLGIFDKNITEITKMVHEAGGFNYYDGANLNAIMGITRPGDMGFDIIHLNLHKTFSTPHGGGGPGSGPVGCKEIFAPFLPKDNTKKVKEEYTFFHPEQTIGRVKAFYGNFLVVVRALTYLYTLGGEGLKEVSENAVLNANYMKHQLSEYYDMPYEGICMHEFVISMERLKKEKNVTAMDVAKTLIDRGIHPPTMYFPLIVHEALMVEPTETENKDTLDQAVEIFKELYEAIQSHPEELQKTPITTPIGRPDETKAARNPKLRYTSSRHS